MRVLYDGFIFRVQKVGGISRYFENLIAHLPGDVEPHVTVRRPLGQGFPQRSRLVAHRVPAWLGRLPRGERFLARACLRSFEGRAAADVLHPTFYETLLGQSAGAVVRRRRKKKTPLVLTVFDMLDEIYAAELDPRGEIAGLKRAAIEAADAILCISQATRRDLQARYAIPDARIVVTPLAASLPEPSPETPGVLPARPYVLFVGNRDVYKNFVRTLFAFARARETWRDLSLGICGAPLNHTEAELIRVLQLHDAVQHLGFVSDAHLAKLYQASVALLYPSLYEGFGIPPLEAMACGTAVITSDRASLPEVVGDAALLVNPESVEEIVAALLRLRDLSSDVRAALIAAGKARAARFNWAETARATAEVYRALAA